MRCLSRSQRRSELGWVRWIDDDDDDDDDDDGCWSIMWTSSPRSLKINRNGIMNHLGKSWQIQSICSFQNEHKTKFSAHKNLQDPSPQICSEASKRSLIFVVPQRYWIPGWSLINHSFSCLGPHPTVFFFKLSGTWKKRQYIFSYMGPKDRSPTRVSSTHKPLMTIHDFCSTSRQMGLSAAFIHRSRPKWTVFFFWMSFLYKKISWECKGNSCNANDHRKYGIIKEQWWLITPGLIIWGGCALGGCAWWESFSCSFLLQTDPAPAIPWHPRMKGQFLHKLIETSGISWDFWGMFQVYIGKFLSTYYWNKILLAFMSI